jgi:hypothetical protein
MKKVFCLAFALLVLVGAAQAVQLELLGGIRDGLAFGVMGETSVARNLGLRYGLEANTGKQPMIAFLGFKFYLTDFRHEMPVSLGMGLVDYFGDKGSNAGISFSLIINRAFNVNSLFIEAGVDVAETGRLQLQVGYKIY